MHTRAISSIGVVLVGLLPTVLGGPAFALLMVALGLMGYREYSALSSRLGAPTSAPAIGYAVIVGFAVAALARGGQMALFGVVALALAAPLVALLPQSDVPGIFARWALAVAGSLYLGLPIFAAIVLRGLGGTVDAGWLAELAERGARGWAAAPRGLAWVLTVIVVTWLGDSAAYLVGRAWGRRLLAPRLSPKKTIEGSLGGVAASALAGGLCVASFGLGINPWFGAAVGAALGIVGQVGDLTESLLKRQARVKDSGTLIPGHGGVLDRIDAQLFALPAGWFLAVYIDRSF